MSVPDRQVHFRDDVDGALMRRVQGDEEGALAAIMQRHWASLVSYTAGFVQTADSAEDIVQEAFVRLWQARKRWTPGGSVRAFLFRTAHNLVLGQVRHRKVVQRTEPEVRSMLEGAEMSPFDVTVREEVRTAVRGALDALAPRRREALILVRLQGLSLDEAAKRMNLSRQTVANHISLALDDLEKSLKDFDL